MYTYTQASLLGQPVRTKIEQHGDCVLFEKDWCPELSKSKSTTCVPAYAAGEQQTSHTNAGHWPSDVVLVPGGLTGPGVNITCRYLIIRDFGVDWRHIKEPTKRELPLLLWLARFETDTTLLFRIVGYSDCIGTPAKNTFLRKGRAFNVLNLLGPSAKKRVLSVGGAPLDTFLVDNTTVQSRANNRSVVIEFFKNPPTVI